MKSPYTFTHTAPQPTGEKQPAIFLLHGLGSNEHDLVQLVADFKEQCHIFSLQGPITHKPGFAFYTFEEEGKPQRDVFDKVIKFTTHFIEEAIAEFSLDPAQIYVVGFNQGAVIAQSIALTMGSAIRGTAALSGYLPEFVALEYTILPQDESKIFISHGEFDYVYPYTWGQASVAYFEEIGANVTFKTYDEGHGVTPQNLQDLIAFLAEGLQKDVN